jgi:hypothetical protein
MFGKARPTPGLSSTANWNFSLLLNDDMEDPDYNLLWSTWTPALEVP